MYVLVSPCILNPEIRAKGITSQQDREWFNRAIERCRRFGIEIVPLPCPETRYLGTNRKPGTFLDQLNTPQFTDLLKSLMSEVRALIKERGPPICIIGVNSSPTCGIDTHFYGPDGSDHSRRSGPGVFLSHFLDILILDVADFSRYRVYLAASLFSQAEKEYNNRLAALLSSHFFEVYLPQEVGEESHLRDRVTHQEIFSRHIQELNTIDLVVAVIDGPDADSGTAWEMGYAYAHKIPVIAIRTDFRMAGSQEYVNLMLEESALVVRSTKELLRAIKSPCQTRDGT